METDARPATSSDLAEITTALAAAFADDPVMRWAFADEVRARRLATLFGLLAEHGYLPHGRCTVLPGGDGAALWLPPGVTLAGSGFWEHHGEPFVVGLEGDVERIGMIGEQLSAHHPHDDHWYLFAIGVAPAAQGRRLGSTLLTHTLALVDERRDPAYLEASSPRSRALYERFGFEVTGEVSAAGSPTVWTMWRSPTHVVTGAGGGRAGR